MKSFVLLGMVGPWQIVLVVLVVLLLFGGKKIPELARGLGRGIREFNDAKASIKDEIEDGIRKEDAKKG